MNSFKQSLEEMEELAGFLAEDLENVQRVISFAEENSLEMDFEVHAKAETCEESAEHSPVSLDQIVKTLVFIGEKPVAVLCPGSQRVDTEKLEDILDTDVRMADPDEVKEATGYPIGAVSPFDLEIPVFMEESLLEEDLLRPAAGSRAVGAEITPEELTKVTDRQIDVKD
ncbi:YbaK/EbsC family protein [Candidatus Nanohalococcus occultus]|uniref:Cys-tRNA(Pro)/Cys-tRNA(Cys) deacylase, ybaK family n=1 Tax=Candidatus Nanohalococcus occultus TaxID=2978047 RepID=A0ABY8CHD6_9ARCH|nr:Cys-tRNA(Pro)/Cys-tRNA(Cys) deacylase, ybaK family [Candidatus Nanohaloarchaeota archaeon SVXNc]